MTDPLTATPSALSARERLKDTHTLIVTWFGSGLSNFMPGTCGSLAALPFAYILHITLGNIGVLVFSLFTFALGWWSTKKYLAANPENSDPGEIVIDEVAGQSLLLAVLFPTWQSYLTGFILFRIFDIIKPWPVSLADRKVKGAFGVMLDDMVAAFFPIFIFIFIMAEAMLLDAGAMLNPVINFLGGSLVSAGTH